MKQLIGNMRKTIEKYDLIENGDNIAVGLSGGKDSLLLLYGLSQLKKYLPQKFNLFAITIDNGNITNDFKSLQDFCDEINVKLKIVKSNIYEVVFEIRKEKNPCSLCAKMRRGLLCSTAKELGANKLALGHHADDVVDTFLMSLIYESRLSTFKPKSYLSNTGITVIRPLYSCFENDIKRLAKEHFKNIIKNTCPANGNTSREEMKNLVNKLEKNYGANRKNIYNAIVSSDRYNLL